MTISRWIKYLVSVLVGNAVYFFLARHVFPPAARHQFHRVDIGIFIDLWFCLVVYGLLELFILLWKHDRRG
jgi:hypothetical protein